MGTYRSLCADFKILYTLYVVVFFQDFSDSNKFAGLLEDDDFDAEDNS